MLRRNLQSAFNDHSIKSLSKIETNENTCSKMFKLNRFHFENIFHFSFPCFVAMILTFSSFAFYFLFVNLSLSINEIMLNVTNKHEFEWSRFTRDMAIQRLLKCKFIGSPTFQIHLIDSSLKVIDKMSSYHSDLFNKNILDS